MQVNLPKENNSDKIITLPEAAEILSVSCDILLEWNENNILKPTITQDGKIGYRKEQIDKFLSIQKIFINEETKKHVQVNPVVTLLNKQGYNQQLNQDFTVNKDSIDEKGVLKEANSKTVPNTIKTSRKFVYVIPFLLLIFISFPTLIYLLKNSSNIPKTESVPVIQDEAQKNYILSENAKNITIPKSVTTQVNVPLDNNTHESEKINISEDSYAALYNIFNKSYEISTTNEYENTTESAILLTQDKNNPSHDIVGTVNDFDLNAMNYASRPNIKQDNNMIADNGGTTNALAVNLGSLQNQITGNPSTNSPAPIILAGLILLSVSSIILLSRKHLAILNFVSDNKVYTSDIESDLTNTVHNNKILELNQKTDGTIVVNFRNEEFKISKPELNSESDQFIERLLDYLPADKKEINYDILEDSNLNLNAPLSKLVTRLGFVGLKRELFFPRTSKNSVIFRKYLIEEDLSTMNLSIDKISEVLSS